MKKIFLSIFLILTILVVLIINLVHSSDFSNFLYSSFKSNHKAFENAKVFENGKLDSMEEAAYIAAFSPPTTFNYPENKGAPSVRIGIYDKEGVLMDLEKIHGSISVDHSVYDHESGNYFFMSSQMNNHIMLGNDGILRTFFVPDHIDYNNHGYGINTVLKNKEKKSFLAIVNANLNDDLSGQTIAMVDNNNGFTQTKKTLSIGFIDAGIYAQSKYYLFSQGYSSDPDKYDFNINIINADNLDIVKTLDINDYNLDSYGWINNLYETSEGNIIVYGSGSNAIGKDSHQSSIIQIDTTNDKVSKAIELKPVDDDTYYFEPYYMYEYNENHYALGLDGKVKVFDNELNEKKEYCLESKTLDMFCSPGFDMNSFSKVKSLGDKYIYLYINSCDSDRSYDQPVYAQIFIFDITSGKEIKVINLSRPPVYDWKGNEEDLCNGSAFEIIGFK
jgi:hypothetical protein